MELQVSIAGILMMILSIVHIDFPRRFAWKKELAALSLLNRQVMQVHTFFIALVVFLAGLLCVTNAHALCHTALGHTICLGMSIFWLARLLIQWFGYSARLWKGKRFETIVHIVFTILWFYFSIIFGWIWWKG